MLPGVLGSERCGVRQSECWGLRNESRACADLMKLLIVETYQLVRTLLHNLVHERAAVRLPIWLKPFCFCHRSRRQVPHLVPPRQVPKRLAVRVRHPRKHKGERAQRRSRARNALRRVEHQRHLLISWSTSEDAAEDELASVREDVRQARSSELHDEVIRGDAVWEDEHGVFRPVEDVGEGPDGGVDPGACLRVVYSGFQRGCDQGSCEASK